MAGCRVQLGGQLGPLVAHPSGMVQLGGGSHLSQLGPLVVLSGGHLAYCGVQLALSLLLCLVYWMLIWAILRF